MRPYAVHVDISLFLKLLLVTVLVTAGACAKDETGADSSVNTGIPAVSKPVTVKEWYPTPKQSGQTSAFGRPGIPPDYLYNFNQQRTEEQGRPWSATTQTPGTFKREIESKPASSPSQMYSPWQVQQAPEYAAAEPGKAGKPVTRRPWGAMDNGNRPSRRQPSQPVWQLQPEWYANQGYAPGYGAPGYGTPGWGVPGIFPGPGW
jgi:hypothetical protein